MIQAFLAFLTLATSSPQSGDFPWETKWHGQRLAVDLISRGEALKGKHFTDKFNRLVEYPWNQMQTLLGAYMIVKLDEDTKKIRDPKVQELLAAETCASVMTMLSNHQQLYEGHVVYQLDNWRAGDAIWQRVWKAPSLAKAIIELSPEEATALDKICGFRKKPLTAPNYSAFSFNDDRRPFCLELPREMKSDELKTLIEKAMPALSEERRNEVEAILRYFRTETDKAKSMNDRIDG